MYVFFIVTVLLSGCAKETDVVVDESGGEILFSVADHFESFVETKATEVTTANLTSIYVTATRGTVGSSETATFSSVNFTGISGGTFSGGKYWPSSNPVYHFYGSNIGTSFASNACTVAASTATDVVCAYMESPTYLTKNTLTFSHIFARIGTVTVNAASGYTISGVTVKITPKVSGTYNIRTGNGKTDGTGWSSVSNGSETTLSSSNNSLYLIPGTYSLKVSYTLSKGDYSESFSKTATVSLSAGVTNNISCTTPTGNAQQIIVSVSLNAWGSEGHNPTFS